MAVLLVKYIIILKNKKYINKKNKNKNLIKIKIIKN